MGNPLYLIQFYFPFSIPLLTLCIIWLIDRVSRLFGKFKAVAMVIICELIFPFLGLAWLIDIFPLSRGIQTLRGSYVSFGTFGVLILLSSFITLIPVSIFAFLVNFLSRRLIPSLSSPITAIVAGGLGCGLSPIIVIYLFMSNYSFAISSTQYSFTLNTQILISGTLIGFLVSVITNFVLLGLGSWGTLRWKESLIISSSSMVVSAIISFAASYVFSVIYQYQITHGFGSYIRSGYAIYIIGDVFLGTVGSVAGGLVSGVLRGLMVGIEQLILLSIGVFAVVLTSMSLSVTGPQNTTNILAVILIILLLGFLLGWSYVFSASVSVFYIGLIMLGITAFFAIALHLTLPIAIFMCGVQVAGAFFIVGIFDIFVKEKRSRWLSIFSTSILGILFAFLGWLYVFGGWKIMVGQN